MTMLLPAPSGWFGRTTVPAEKPSWSMPFPQSGAVAINKNDAVAIAFNTSTGVLTAIPFDTDAAGQTPVAGVGVARNAAAANSGTMVDVVVYGYAEVNVAAGTPTAGQVLVGTTTAGVAAGATPDATTVAGTVIGRVLSGKIGTTNNVAVWVTT